MKNYRWLWVIERVYPTGRIVLDEMTFAYRSEARRKAKSVTHWTKIKTRVVKYVPEK